MLWKMKKVCEGDRPVRVAVAFGSRSSFSSLSIVFLLVTCSQLDLDVFLFSPFMAGAITVQTEPLSHMSRSGSRAVKESSDYFSVMVSL